VLIVGPDYLIGRRLCVREIWVCQHCANDSVQLTHVLGLEGESLTAWARIRGILTRDYYYTAVAGLDSMEFLHTCRLLGPRFLCAISLSTWVCVVLKVCLLAGICEHLPTADPDYMSAAPE